MMVRQQVTKSYHRHHLCMQILTSYQHHIIIMPSSHWHPHQSIISNDITSTQFDNVCHNHHLCMVILWSSYYHRILSLQAIPASTLPYSQHEPRDWDIPRGLLYSLTLITTIGHHHDVCGDDDGDDDDDDDGTSLVITNQKSKLRNDLRKRLRRRRVRTWASCKSHLPRGERSLCLTP